MLVLAKYQLGYKGKAYLGGDTFEIDGEDFLDYQKDVIVLPMPDLPEFKPKGVKELKSEKTKVVKKSKTKKLKTK